MAWVEKRGSKCYRVRYYGPDGREHNRTFTKASEANQFDNIVEVSVMHGDWVDPALGKVLFTDYAEEWISTKAAVWPTDLHEYSRTAGRARASLLREDAARKIAPVHVRAFVARLVGSGLAPSTVKGVYLTTSQIFAAAVTDGLIRRTPCVGIELPRERDREETHFLTPEQLNLLAESITHRYRVLIYTAAYTGMRAGELAALRVHNINLLARTVDVVASMVETRGALVPGPTKTAGDARS